jgi:hypothetical protein
MKTILFIFSMPVILLVWLVCWACDRRHGPLSLAILIGCVACYGGETSTVAPTNWVGTLSRGVEYIGAYNSTYTGFTNTRAQMSLGTISRNGESAGVDVGGRLLLYHQWGLEAHGTFLDSTSAFSYGHVAVCEEIIYGNLAIIPAVGVGYDLDASKPLAVAGITIQKMVNDRLGVFTGAWLNVDMDRKQTGTYCAGIVIRLWKH